MLVKVTHDRGHSSRKAFLNLDFQFVSMRDRENKTLLFQKPKHWNEMIQLAKVLSKDFPFVRVDLYDVEGKVYFGELTFTPANGMNNELPPEIDKKMGDLYDLSIYSRS